MKLVKRENSKNDKLIFYTMETFVTVFYGLVSGSYVIPPRLIIIKDVQLDKQNPQEETERERNGDRENTRDIKESPTK